MTLTINSMKEEEKEIMEYLQGVAGSGVPIIKTKSYTVLWEGMKQLYGAIRISEMGEAATRNLFDEINALVIKKFNRAIVVGGGRIFVSWPLAPVTVKI